MRQGRLITKVRVSASVAFAVVLAVSVTALDRTRASHKDVAEFTEVQFPAAQLLAQIGEGRLEIDKAALALDAVGGRSPKQRDELRGDLEMSFAVLEEGITSYEGMEQAKALRSEWEEVRGKLEAWRASIDAVASMLDKGDEAAIARAWEGARATSREAEEALLTYRKVSAGQVGAVKARSAASFRGALVLIGLVSLLGILAAIAGGWGLERSVRGSLRALVSEAARVESAIEDGALDVRADAAAASVEFAPVVDGMNRMVDAFQAPLRLASSCVERIARGDIPQRIEGDHRGDFGKLVHDLNCCIDAVNALVEDAGRLAEAGAAGKLGTRVDARRHAGDFRKVVEGMNQTLDGLLLPLEVAASAVAEIAAGRLPPEITAGFRGDLVTLRDNVNHCIRGVRALVSDVRVLADAGAAGRLTVRVDAGAHQGEFRTIVEGMNRTLDGVVMPLQAAARCVGQISSGQLPAPIADEWPGDFGSLRDNLNTCIAAVGALVRDIDGLATTAVEGKLAQRADASKHRGDYRRILEGVNRTLDTLLAPVSETAVALEALASRDLRVRMNQEYQGDHSRLTRALNSTAEALDDAMRQVSSAVEHVSLAAGQIASSSQAVAQGASEQAASLAETGASLGSVAGRVRQAAEGAQQARLMATSARAAATEGTAAVERLHGAMERIQRSAEGTRQIIKNVSEIAFQTNLLALNAAVEAARAGDAGRGFAVVAEEVRSLALRAKEAASKTEELIRQSVNEANEGHGAARQVAGKLGDIVQGVTRVTDLVTEIAASAQEQASAVAQVNHAVSEMGRVTQQNASSAEESSSAASELSSQAEELASMVATFQIDRQASAAPTPSRAPVGPGGRDDGDRGREATEGRSASAPRRRPTSTRPPR